MNIPRAEPSDFLTYLHLEKTQPMDAALYEKLLDDVRSDLDQSAPKLAEMQSVESFLQDRMERTSDKSNYQKVLDDLAADIQNTNQTVAELQRIDQFVSSQLGKPSHTPAAAASERPRSQPNPPKKDEDTKEQRPRRLEDLPGDRSGMTIEFGPDGFPISAPPKDKSENDSKKPNPQGAGMDGATINFGPDGFPLDVPKRG